MNIKELCNYGIPEDIVMKFEKENIKELYPHQSASIKKGLLNGKSIILSVPTASGKTMLASLAAISKLSKKPCKVVYIVPLVALANEKYEYYKKLLGDKWKVALSVGDMDSKNTKLSKYDFIVCTTEKLDSLIRHRSNWIDEIDLVIIDEIHLINDSSRGPTLEVVITQLKEMLPDAQLLGLSATISNSDELSEWMDAILIESDFRPVVLHEGVSSSGKIKFYDKKDCVLEKTDLEEAIMSDTMSLNKQSIYFLSSRRNAESLAKRLTVVIKKKLTSSELSQLEQVSDDILSALDSPTKQCKKLAECIKHGSAFHHAGLVRSQKTIIEDNFRKGIIKSISATPTLAAGINLPAFRVIIRDTKRYYHGIGSTFIPVLEYKQMVGRAGRPQYDDFGESILFARSESEADKLAERFIMGEPEKIRSKLSMEPVLRMHILSLVSNSSVDTEKRLAEFFSKTFYAHQYGDIDSIRDKIDEILYQLVDWGFITETNGDITATKLGKRVSQLYIDPLTASKFIDTLEKSKAGMSVFGILQAISNSKEMRPLLSVRSGDVDDINQIIIERHNEIIQEIPTEWDYDFDEFVKSVKTASFFESWINETPEDDILDKFKVAPGELRWRLSTADWLVYAFQELAFLLNMKEHLSQIKKTRILLKYGAKAELLPLVKIKGIGRVRARKLFKSNVKSVAELRKISVDSLGRILGPNVAYNVKNQLGEKLKKPDHLKKSKQVRLISFE